MAGRDSSGRRIEPDGQRPRVVYIGGYSRSGSTLLLRLLAQAPSCVAVGELVNIWDRGLRQNQLCGCGAPFRDCTFWRSVLEEAFNEPVERLNGESLVRLHASVLAYARFVPLWLPVVRGPGMLRSMASYGEVVTSLYQAITVVSGGDCIVDSSKVPQFFRFLSELGSLDVQLIHLIRDSRATAFSWQRKKPRPEIYWAKQEMARYSTFRSALEWDIFNSLLLHDKARGRSYVLVRYEDLVSGPGATLATVAAALDWEGLGSSAEGLARSVDLPAAHTVAGNPSRFDSGVVQIKSDDEWRSRMPRGKRIVVTALTAPLLRRAGYGGGGSSNGAGLDGP